MSSEHCRRSCRSCILFVVLAVVIGILFGLSETALWVFGYIPDVRFVIPYAAADAMLIFALAPMLAYWEKKISLKNEDYHPSNLCLSGYVKTIMSSAGVFLIFVQIYIGAHLLLIRNVKIVMSFVGTISFSVMFIVFIGFVFSLICNRHK